MNIRLMLCIAMGVFVAHLGVIMIIAQFRPKPPPRPRPNFSAQSTAFVDPNTGEKIVYREITVSTKFASTPVPSPAAPPQIEPVAAP